MKKLKFAVVCLVIVLVGVFLNTGERLFKFDFGETVNLSQFQLMAVDNTGNIYGVYTEEVDKKEECNIMQPPQSYIMKITPANKVDVAIVLDKTNQIVKGIEVDDTGRIYVHSVNYQYDMLRVESEEIVMYSSKGIEKKGLYKYEYDYGEIETNEPSEKFVIKTLMKLESFINVMKLELEERFRYSKKEVEIHQTDTPLYEVGKIKNIEIVTSDTDTNLYIYSVENNNEIVVKQHNIKEKMATVVERIIIPSHRYPLHIVGYQAGQMWYTTVDGSLYYVDDKKESIYISVDQSLDYYTISNIVSSPLTYGSICVELEDPKGKILIYKGGYKIPFEVKVVKSSLKNTESNICLNNKNDLYYQNDSTILYKTDGGSTKFGGKARISKRYFLWQVLYINMIVLFIVLILLLFFMYYRLVLEKKLSVVLKQSIFMLVIFSIFAVVMMGYIETMFLKQAEMMDGNVKKVFEEIVDKKLEESNIVDVFNRVNYLSELKVDKLKKIESIPNIDKQNDALKLVIEELNSGIFSADEIDKDKTDLNQLMTIVDTKYKESVDIVNQLPEGSLDLLKGVKINKDSYFIALYHVKVDKDDITYASTIVNSDDSDRVICVRDIDLYIGNKTEREDYLDGAFVSGCSSDEKWIRSGKLVSHEEGDKPYHFIYRIGMNYDGYKNSVVMRNLNALESTMKLLIILAISLLLISIRLNLNPIKVLTRFVSEITEYDQAPTIDLKSKDEIGDLSKAFNDLLKDIKEKFLEQIKIYTVYSKYVPKEYEAYLGKTIMELELGDFCEEKMTVMCFYVHDMFEIIESFGNQKHAFMFIKEYLDEISKIIRSHEGVVTRYDDGGIMAIFESNSNAIQASIEITMIVREVNKTSETKINIGIGLNRGNLLLGVVGEESRMQLSIISKHSNIALDLAKRTVDYSSNILMTHEVMRKKDTVYSVSIRYLGYIMPLNSDKEIMFYDLYESDCEDDFNNKQTTKDLFDEALILYQAGDFLNARYKFRKVIDINHDDLVAQKYYFLSDGYKLLSKNEIPHWSPVLS